MWCFVLGAVVLGAVVLGEVVHLLMAPGGHLDIGETEILVPVLVIGAGGRAALPGGEVGGAEGK